MQFIVNKLLGVKQMPKWCIKI